ncbi:hypothetical protein V7150_22500 [Neobacillus drentensis]|uniref:hypothetical protein n=1 Tax=Neobacillus drentensis TaxID=220684 RepID=UPI002FFE8C74
MLGNVVFFILFIILAIELFKNLKKGIIKYIVFALVSPHLNIGDFQISFEIFSFFLVLVVVLIKDSSVFLIYRKYLYRQHLMIYFIVFILASLLAVIRFGSEIPWISFIAIFRVVCLIYMLQYVMKDSPEETIDQIISPILFINLAVSIIQITVPASTRLFYEFYYKTSLTPLEAVLKLGYFDRGYGTFGTPVLLGVFSLLSFAVYFGFFVERKNFKRKYLKLISSIIIGLLALSKTAIIGIPSILVLCCILSFLGVIKVKNRKVLLLPLIVIPIFGITVRLLERQGTAITWYLSFLRNPFKAFETRYDTTSGILANTYSTITSNWMLGVGGTPLANDFIGDSMYTGIIYSTGVLGLFIYFSALIISTIKNLKFRNATALLCFVVICLTGFGAPIQLHIISVPLLAYMFSKSEEVINKEHKLGTNNKL